MNFLHFQVMRYLHNYKIEGGIDPTYIELWVYMQKYYYVRDKITISSRLSELKKFEFVESYKENGMSKFILTSEGSKVFHLHYDVNTKFIKLMEEHDAKRWIFRNPNN